MALNQTSHTRPILPTYDQALGVDLGEESILRLPRYKESYLARYNPYGRSSFHHRFLCNDVRMIFLLCFSYISPTAQDVPAYDEASVNLH